MNPRFITTPEELGAKAQLPESEVPTWRGVLAMPHPARRRVRPRTGKSAMAVRPRFCMGEPFGPSEEVFKR
jgi:hypothetical protein